MLFAQVASRSCCNKNIYLVFRTLGAAPNGHPPVDNTVAPTVKTAVVPASKPTPVPSVKSITDTALLSANGSGERMSSLGVGLGSDECISIKDTPVARCQAATTPPIILCRVLPTAKAIAETIPDPSGVLKLALALIQNRRQPFGLVSSN